ncbi:MAG TPA: DUF4230 domain-containing protein [Anaerolineales bacterium]|nr:DUF4230 domain-containing protein [Anaerolineales bacterium]
MKNSSNWVLIIGILLILVIGMFAVVNTVRNIMERALQPVQDTTGALGTQVSSVLNPTPTVLADPITIIHEVRALARLETVQYSVEKVITAESGQGLFGTLFGDKLLFVAHGVVIAGVDLEKLGPEDMWLENGVLYVKLPEPEIFIATLDNDKSYVYNRETGLLTKGDVNLETTARQVAEDAVAESALEDGILGQAGRNAEAYFSILFRNLGYPEVIFVDEKPE